MFEKNEILHDSMVETNARYFSFTFKKRKTHLREHTKTRENEKRVKLHNEIMLSIEKGEICDWKKNLDSILDDSFFYFCFLLRCNSVFLCQHPQGFFFFPLLKGGYNAEKQQCVCPFVRVKVKGTSQHRHFQGFLEIKSFFRQKVKTVFFHTEL